MKERSPIEQKEEEFKHFRRKIRLNQRTNQEIPVDWLKRVVELDKFLVENRPGWVSEFEYDKNTDSNNN